MCFCPLQQPKTSFKDEKIFIIYHQITELYFNWLSWNWSKSQDKGPPFEELFIERMERNHDVFGHLTYLLCDDVESVWSARSNFKFRMSFIASHPVGFQSAHTEKSNWMAKQMLSTWCAFNQGRAMIINSLLNDLSSICVLAARSDRIGHWSEKLERWKTWAEVWQETNRTESKTSQAKNLAKIYELGKPSDQVDPRSASVWLKSQMWFWPCGSLQLPRCGTPKRPCRYRSNRKGLTARNTCLLVFKKGFSSGSFGQKPKKKSGGKAGGQRDFGKIEKLKRSLFLIGEFFQRKSLRISKAKVIYQIAR